MLNPLKVFDLGDDIHGRTAFLAENFSDLQDILGAAGEAGGHKIKPAADAEENILPILGADKGHGQVGPRDVHSLVVGNDAVV